MSDGAARRELRSGLLLYDADRIDAAAEAWRKPAPIGSLMRRLGCLATLASGSWVRP
jgi:hypothetical protein